MESGSSSSSPHAQIRVVHILCSGPSFPKATSAGQIVKSARFAGGKGRDGGRRTRGCKKHRDASAVTRSDVVPTCIGSTDLCTENLPDATVLFGGPLRRLPPMARCVSRPQDGGNRVSSLPGKATLSVSSCPRTSGRGQALRTGPGQLSGVIVPFGSLQWAHSPLPGLGAA